jgi:hypothetical protein
MIILHSVIMGKRKIIKYQMFINHGMIIYTRERAVGKTTILDDSCLSIQVTAKSSNLCTSAQLKTSLGEVHHSP